MSANLFKKSTNLQICDLLDLFAERPPLYLWDIEMVKTGRKKDTEKDTTNLHQLLLSLIIQI
jgi:hypothetical protein